jgi:hypothetical protein
MKKTIIIIGGLTVIGVGAYLFFKPKKALKDSINESDKNTTTSGGTTSGGTTSGGTTSGGTKPSDSILVGAVLGGTTSNSTQLNDVRKTIVINSATYGEGKNKLDIKKTIEDLLKIGIYEFRATNQFFGKDPSRGKVKYVIIDYSINGVKVPLSVFNSETSGFRSDIDGVREGQLVKLYKNT